MTNEEFQRIKEAEKERLRAQKRLRATLESLKQRNEVQAVVRRMSKGAKRLLRETEAFAEKVASQAAQQAARLEVAAEEEREDDLSLADAEEALREERAEEYLRRIKTEEPPAASRHSQTASAGTEESAPSDATEERSDDGPDKTIGRMGDRRADD